MRGEKNHSFFGGSFNGPQNETHDEFNYHQKDNVLFFVASRPFGNLIFGRDAISGVRLIEMVEATRDGRDRKNLGTRFCCRTTTPLGIFWIPD